MNGKEQLEHARERVIETIAMNMNLYGVTDSVGRLYGMLYFHDQPLTLDEMKEELGMSKTSMSTSVRTLLELKMVEKIWKKGIRKDLYQAEEDWYQTFIDFFSIKWRAGISMNVSAMKKSLKELETLVNSEATDEEIRRAASIDIEKMKDALRYYEWLNRLVDSFDSGKIFDFIPKDEEK
ncbi:GbsR/MarR family transcriptional regulator [Bacillus sp. DTU_2020_1000418_1_SI_GHA_SEK_038]|uniref:GbsR/MarR family transcriptional regulator n=1 Tax=Bacillus sp. DTU_2020_1000418_1_SI_GHA_SEK_038 TaxID=3077585 RepID=UPI0028E684DC|nr:GbsR/MarR family transcriptional regulator [Bacillus sp. DTU_2020_1000418_1_SI_GHA_SEK_038]WNS74198.1 GbsR/MarR family transcriptional regulator [Bacillus sp. DTU_2020_1000418_1_SI_GHA_SEK_038]